MMMKRKRDILFVHCYCYIVSLLYLFRCTSQERPPCAFPKNSISTSWDTARFSKCNAVNSIEGLLQYGQYEYFPCQNGTALGNCHLTVDGCPYQCLVRLGRREADSQTLTIRLAEAVPGLFPGMPAFQFESLVLPQFIQNW